jgi:hypothetical protein
VGWTRFFAVRESESIPVAFGWHNVVNLELLCDFLNAQMQRVGVELFSSHVAVDGCGQAHQASSLVLARITPSVALLALARAVGICRIAVSMRSS